MQAEPVAGQCASRASLPRRGRLRISGQGSTPGLEDLAKGLKIGRSYLGRRLSLTSLAPNIVEAMVRGKEPEGVSLRQLHGGVLLCWQEQGEGAGTADGTRGSDCSLRRGLQAPQACRELNGGACCQK